MAAKKAKTRPRGVAPGRVRKTYHLTADTARRVAVAAADAGQDESALVEAALSARYSGVTVFDRNAPKAGVKLADEPPGESPDHQAA